MLTITGAGNVMLQAAKNHERLHPYIYSQAVRFAHDGFPWTMTPLLIAPNDAYTVSFAGTKAGTYKFYCTPHLALGMKGTVTVQ